MMLRAILLSHLVLVVPALNPIPEITARLATEARETVAVSDRGPLHDPPVAEGVVERYVIDPRGEIEGLLLTDGAHMYVTSRAADQLLHAIKPGDRIRVYGLRGEDSKLIRPDIIRNLSNGTTFTVPLRLDLPMYEQERHLSVTELQATGTIQVLLSHPSKNVVQGMVLSDGTQIRLPLDISDELRRSFHVGDTVTVRGNGTENQYGRSIEAVAMGRPRSRLITLDASLRSLP